MKQSQMSNLVYDWSMKDENMCEWNYFRDNR